jgi:hypothetical protein
MVDFRQPEASPSALSASVGQDLLRGAGEICVELYGADTKENRRRLYHEQKRWPLFRLEDDGVLYALRSRLRAHVAAKSAIREAQITAAALAEADVPKQSKPHRRRQRACNRRSHIAAE